MIIATKAKTHDEPFLIVLYHPDENGRCVPRVMESDTAEVIDTYYQQRTKELMRLHEAVISGDISPIGFFVAYQHMDIKDVAARVRLRRSLVKRHMTLSGFATARVAHLQRYAKVFDVAVGDFFDFSFVDEAISVDSKRFHNRLIHQETFSIKKPEEPAPRKEDAPR